MRVLVTGGCGFIGSHVSVRLISLGHEIAIVDDFNDFYDPGLKEHNLELIRSAGPAVLFRTDIRDTGGVEQAFAAFRPEAVIHLAARAGVRPSLADPLLYEQVNGGGTVVILEAMRRHGVRKLVFASSSSVYGTTNRVPFSEADTELRPISPYAATKIAGEKLCYTFSHLYGISVLCLRFFTVYGPRQRPDLAIRRFLRQIDAGEDVTMFGDGSMGRDFTYVTDTVDGVMAALAYDTPFDVINLGNSSPVTVAQTVAMIEALLGKKAQIKHLPVPSGDVPLTRADISKARALLGYEPKVPFAEGLERMASWWRDAK